MTVTESSHSAVIRPMTRSDIPELLRLMRALVAFERGTDFRLDEAELLRRGFGEQADFGAFVADVGGAVVGFAAYYEIPFMHSLQPLLMMKWLFVDPERRGAGIGEQLLRRMTEHARSHRSQEVLLVRPQRQPSRAEILSRLWSNPRPGMGSVGNGAGSGLSSAFGGLPQARWLRNVGRHFFREGRRRAVEPDPRVDARLISKAIGTARARGDTRTSRFSPRPEAV